MVKNENFKIVFFQKVNEHDNHIFSTVFIDHKNVYQTRITKYYNKWLGFSILIDNTGIKSRILFTQYYEFRLSKKL